MKSDQLTKRHKGSYLLTNRMTGLRFGIGISAGYMDGDWYVYLKGGLKGEVLHYGRTRRECLQFIEKYQENYVVEMARFITSSAEYNFPPDFRYVYFIGTMERTYEVQKGAAFEFIEVRKKRKTPNPLGFRYRVMVYIYGHGIFTLDLERVEFGKQPSWVSDLLDMADRWLERQHEN